MAGRGGGRRSVTVGRTESALCKTPPLLHLGRERAMPVSQHLWRHVPISRGRPETAACRASCLGSSGRQRASAKPASIATSHRPVPVSAVAAVRIVRRSVVLRTRSRFWRLGWKPSAWSTISLRCSIAAGARSPVASLAVALVLKNRLAAPFSVERADGSPLPSASSHAIRRSPRSPPMTASR